LYVTWIKEFFEVFSFLWIAKQSSQKWKANRMITAGITQTRAFCQEAFEKSYLPERFESQNNGIIRSWIKNRFSNNLRGFF